ncbi:MAG: hypothetical protein LBR84_06700 [Tannerella sp.]|jgi:hypothetical protein|nr:hypothetical protein [Tannerella sp.]
MKTLYKNIFAVFAALCLFSACEESIIKNSGITDPEIDPSKTPTGVTTGEVIDNLGASVVLSGSVSGDGGSSILDNGFILHTSSNFTLDSANLVVGSATNPAVGSFEATVTGLIINTTYYYRAFSYNINGITLGEVKSLLTAGGLPTPYSTKFDPSKPTDIQGWVFDKYTGFDPEGLDPVWFNEDVGETCVSSYWMGEDLTLISPCFYITNESDVLKFNVFIGGYGSTATKVKVYITEDLDNYGAPLKNWEISGYTYGPISINMASYYKKNVYIIYVIEAGDFILYNFSIAPPA